MTRNELAKVRVHYKDGMYIETDICHSWEYENDPDYDRTEKLMEVVTKEEILEKIEEAVVWSPHGNGNDKVVKSFEELADYVLALIENEKTKAINALLTEEEITHIIFNSELYKNANFSGMIHETNNIAKEIIKAQKERWDEQ